MKLFGKLTLVVVAALSCAVPSQAELRFGPRIGAQVNHMEFNRDVLKASNRTGLTAGLVMEYLIDDVGFGFDVAAMYAHRSGELPTLSSIVGLPTETGRKYAGGDYIEVPIHLKYKVPVPAVAPYVFTGPSIAFLASEQSALEAYEQKKFDSAWDLGAGIELLDHLQLDFRYSWGISKAVTSKLGWLDGENLIEGRNRHYTITATWLF